LRYSHLLTDTKIVPQTTALKGEERIMLCLTKRQAAILLGVVLFSPYLALLDRDFFNECRKYYS